MKVGVFHNETVSRGIAEKLASAFVEAGAVAVVFDRAEEIAGVDRLVVLGGDGTVLHAAKRASREGIPLVAVNFGTIGFLTEFGREELLLAVPLVLDEHCPTIARSMIEVEMGGKRCDCLNEVSLQREVSERENAHVLPISVRIDGSSAGELFADGVIVATPTGSTAYSLSAGGCIMSPDCKDFLMTPICAFSLRSRPVALPDSSVLRISAGKGGLLVYGDGVFFGRLSPGACVTIERSNRSAVFLTRSKREFFRRLTEKIN